MPALGEKISAVYILILLCYYTTRFVRRSPNWLTRAVDQQQDNSVAIILAGGARSLNYTICSLGDQVLKPLLRQSPSVHVFVHSPSRQSDWGPLLTATATALNIQVHFQRASLVVPPKCQKLVRQRMGSFWEASPGRAPPDELLSILAHRHEANLMRRRHEKTNRMTFQWVIFLRADVLFMNALPAMQTWHPSAITVVPWQSWRGMNDRFALMPRALADAYFGLYPFLCLQDGASTLPRVLNQEGLHLWYLLLLRRVQLQFLDPFYFVRYRIPSPHYPNITAGPMKEELRLLDLDHCRQAMQMNNCKGNTGDRCSSTCPQSEVNEGPCDSLMKLPKRKHWMNYKMLRKPDQIFQPWVESLERLPQSKGSKNDQ